MVLIFTNKEDAHPNPVIDLLTERGVPFFRLNTECLLTDYAFSWTADGSGCELEIRDKTNGARLIGSEISAVWDRRPERPKSLPIENTEKIKGHCFLNIFSSIFGGHIVTSCPIKVKSE